MLIIKTGPGRLPEKQYCFDVLLGEFLGLPFRVELVSATDTTQIELPNGGMIVFPDTFRESATDPAVSVVNEFPVELPHPFDPALPPLPVICGKSQWNAAFGIIQCGLDVFASSFFMLTRWEEINPAIPDAHGRFPARASLAFQWKFLSRPVVNEYADLLGKMLGQLGMPLPDLKRQTSLLITHDVDHPKLWWTPLDRIRTLAGSLVKRRNPVETNGWLRQKKDPYDTFGFLMECSESVECISHFNFMGLRDRQSDCYYPLNHPFVLNLIRTIDERGHRIGFHPSYESYGRPDIFLQELASLQAVSPQSIVSGRQHYLRFSVPETWQQWENAGLAWDSTMGYADMPGFRCGTCFDFPVFNAVTRTKLNLREKPLIAMDVTLASYLRLQPEAAWEILSALKQEVYRYRGSFTLLWHNSSLDDVVWTGWRELYKSFIQTF